MKARAYIETSMISYLTAKPSRDVVAAAHQQISLDWWERRRHDFNLVASLLVVNALHIATAAVHQVEYLLTWNCSHIANAEILPRIAMICDP